MVKKEVPPASANTDDTALGSSRCFDMYKRRKRYSTWMSSKAKMFANLSLGVISRQFREMSRIRIESLLASFPKLIPTNTQHTTVETSDVRFVYQPLEDLYILLITNKTSNILLDIDTLHLFARVVSDMCRTADEREILTKSFEILGAFDEIVSMGYREQVNLIQVRSVLEMESHEEKIQEIIARVRTETNIQYRVLNCFVYRTRRPKRKKSSNVVPNSWKCNVGSNNVEQPARVEEAIILAGVSQAILLFPDTMHQTRRLPA